MDSSFGHWLAGFIDGEGCFIVTKSPRYQFLSTKFELKQRYDNKAILYSIQETLGFGKIRHVKRQGNSQSCYAYQLESQDQCLKLINILDMYTLRGDKIEEYKIWREIVLERQRLQEQGLRNKDWSLAHTLYYRLKERRQASRERAAVGV